MLYSLNKETSSITSMTGCEHVSAPELYFVAGNSQEFFYETFSTEMSICWNLNFPQFKFRCKYNQGEFVN